MNKKFGYISDPKRKTGQFYNTVLKSLYESFWPYCGNITIFHNTFIVERNRQLKYSSNSGNFQSKLAYFKSENEACAGKYLKEDYFPLPHDVDNLERLIDNASKLEQKVVTEIEKISKDDDSLFCQNGRLKSGRQSQHNFNEDTIHKMNIFIADEIKPFNKTLVELKQKCKVTSWNKRGKKRTDKQRKRENKWKVEARTKCRKLNRCKEIYELFGGHLMSECFTPEMGAYQITEIEDTCTFIENIFSDTLSEFDKCCLAHMVKEGCFRELALEFIEQYLYQ